MRPIRFLLILLILFMSADLAMGQRAGQSPFTRQRSYSGSERLDNDWRSGIINIPEIGYGNGIAGTSSPMSKMEISITNVTGYQFTRNIKAGIGYGFQIYNDGILMPLFFDTRVSMNGRTLVPFVSSTTGAAISFDDFESSTRIFVNPAIGMRYVVKSNLAASLSAGLLIHGGRHSRASFMSMKLGVVFKGSKWNF